MSSEYGSLINSVVNPEEIQEKTVSFTVHVPKSFKRKWKECAYLNGYDGRLAEFVAEALEEKCDQLPRKPN